MANRNVILSLSKDPLTPTPFDRLTTPLSLGGEREIRVVIFLRRYLPSGSQKYFSTTNDRY